MSAYTPPATGDASEAMSEAASWCPQCGPGVRVDEDGLCRDCGATATGRGADQALRLRAENERLHKQLDEGEASIFNLRLDFETVQAALRYIGRTGGEKMLTELETMRSYQTGEVVRFVAQRRATCHGRRYNAGDTIRIVLAHDWCEEDGLGEGGPWGWGGYTTRKIKNLGAVVTGQRCGGDVIFSGIA